MNKYKTCTKCLQSKSLTAFYHHKTGKFGKHSQCIDCLKAIRHSKYEKDPIAYNAYRKTWADQNKEKVKSKNKRYRDQNKKALANVQHRRRARIKSNGIFDVSKKELARLYATACFYCDSKIDITIDHIFPISRGGQHSIGNLVSSCSRCNTQKGSRFLMEWKLAVSKVMRERVIKRDNHQCWHCPEVEAISLQHRRNRQMGGSKNLDRMDNLIVLCSAMNGLIESNSDAAAEARDFGWKLSSWDSFEMPVFNRNELKWYQIDVNGNKTEVDPPGYLI